jgi:iduronate 2-sulfatase
MANFHSPRTFYVNLAAICLITLVAISSMITPVAGEEPVAKPSKMNVLFIAVDDLRPELNCYGCTHIRSPHIDALAASGMMFERAYCMVPVCGASRASLMTGIRPSRHRFVNYLTRADKDAPDIVALNAHFRNNGYHTISNGKIFHHRDDCLPGWSEEPWRPRIGGYQLAESRELATKNAQLPGRRRRGPPYEAAPADDNDYPDGRTATKSIEDLKRLSTTQQPFFLAVGFLKPHLPFVAPQKYWDMYDRRNIKLPRNYRIPKDAPRQAIHNSGELRAYAGIPPKGLLDDEMARALIHGYYACVSFVDAQVGRVLDALDALGLAKNTIVILWGDHGWNLGDHTMWCKHCCFESSMRVPLIVRAPQLPTAAKSAALVEFIDIYPSLCELTGIDPPTHLEGTSFVPLLKNPDAPWKQVAIGRFHAGDTICTDRFRFTEYSAASGKLEASMLYDHQLDPLENVNISEQADSAAQVQQLTRQLHSGMGRDDDLISSSKHPEK